MLTLGKFYEFEIKAKEHDNHLRWEYIVPVEVKSTEHDCYLTLDMYITFLNENGKDLSQIKEFRINRLGNAQGHCVSPKDGKWSWSENEKASYCHICGRQIYEIQDWSEAEWWD